MIVPVFYAVFMFFPAGRSPIVFLGLITHITCFVLVYLNLPERATIEETNDAPIFESPIPWLAIVCAMFMGKNLDDFYIVHFPITIFIAN